MYEMLDMVYQMLDVLFGPIVTAILCIYLIVTVVRVNRLKEELAKAREETENVKQYLDDQLTNALQRINRLEDRLDKRRN